MKILVVFFSRTGTTKKVALAIGAGLNADIEEIIGTIDRSGVKGYFISGREAMKKTLAKVEPVKSDASLYDLVIIGTPIWAWNISSPIRSYISENKQKFKAVAFFCTMGGSGDEQAFREMQTIIGKDPIATLSLMTNEVAKDKYKDKLELFLKSLRF